MKDFMEQSYKVVKAVYPIKTTPKAGVNVQELVKAQFPEYHRYFNKYFDWNDIDGILDFLYFHAKILHVIEAQQLIDLIENNCEIEKMVKVRLWGENAEIETLIERICNELPCVCVLSVSGHYKDRGASVYERCYLDVELNEQPPKAHESVTKSLIKGLKK